MKPVKRAERTPPCALHLAHGMMLRGERQQKRTGRGCSSLRPTLETGNFFRKFFEVTNEMSFRSKFALIVLSATLTLYAVIGGWMSTRAQQEGNDPGAQLRIFENVLQHIQNDYVDEPNMEKVRAGALRGLAYGLDPYSTYLTPEQVRDYRAANNDSQVGIGAELSQVASYLYVVAQMKGSPADQAGIKPGDIIEYIDNKATRDISLYDANQLL